MKKADYQNGKWFNIFDFFLEGLVNFVGTATDSVSVWVIPLRWVFEVEVEVTDPRKGDKFETPPPNELRWTFDGGVCCGGDENKW